MKKHIELAKAQGLNWKTILLEDAEMEIKVVVKNACVQKLPLGVIRSSVQKIIAEVVRDLEDIEFGEKVAKSLFSFSSQIYSQLSRALESYSPSAIAAMNVIVSGGSKREKAQASKTVRKLVEDIDVNEYEDVEYIENAQPLNEFNKTYMKKVKQAFNELEQATPKDSGISLRLSAELKVRQDYHLNQLASLNKKGVRLVWTSTHGNCSKRCEPYQGRLWSLDGTSGTMDGIPFKPLEVATDIFYTTKKGKTYKNGIISGFGCRHQLIEYYKGNKPPHVSAETIDKQREINDKQRYMERTIRTFRQRTMLYRGVDDKLSKEARKKAIAWNKKYVQYSRENNVAYYPSRLQIFET